MLKYEKPQLVDINQLAHAEGSPGPGCESGSVNIDICGNGQTVMNGCDAGGSPTWDCAEGGNI